MSSNNIAVANEKKRLIVTIAGACVVGVVTGLFMGGAILPFRVPAQQFVVKSGETARQLNVVHATETISQHEHRVTTIITVEETSPHGYFHDFLASLTAGLFTQAEKVAAQAPNEITVWAREYHPNSLTVPVGTKVVWINKDAEEHTINADDGTFGGVLSGLGTYSFTFNQAGTYKYYCEPHPGMLGVIIVK